MPPSGVRLLDLCRHPLVRDLAWLILVPDLITMPCPGRPSRETLGLADDDRLAGWLSALETRPGALEAHLAGTLRGRMGLYHERLWQFLLDEAPATRLIAHNLRIHQGKRTLGELDLLYCRLDDPRPIHLEVAIKYYLGLPEGPGADGDQARWIGPGGADSLASKREHLYRHQLRLGDAPEARAVLARLMAEAWPVGLSNGGLPLRCRLAIPGVLFYPWHATLPAPRDATADHLRGHWLYRRDWHALLDRRPLTVRGAWLHKPHWLALPRPEAFVPLWELSAGLDRHFAQTEAPVQIALQGPGSNVSRFFVVPDDWPRQIPLPPMPACSDS
ncbi:DUF1853 family protein [Halomonas cerina]|uniref:DUF1853 family protein n=1 Tax=Halomonas cerina TaxID=447424 RepID=A0A839VCZ6_9GAMM|nr:DUF1853 family protein [Halomonas cerina]MBB3191895.1 hypothetical protein [Halomonas cerina]